MTLNHGEVVFPGIPADGYESFTFTDSSGAQPGVGSMKFYAERGLPLQDGIVTLTYNSNQIVLNNCHIVSIDYEDGSGGQIGTVHFLDERWAWQFASISGKYNWKLPNNWPDPNHQLNPQQLASILFNALGYTTFDVSQLPVLPRPEVDWDHANPGCELEKLAADYGCRIVCQRSTGLWTIQTTGVGNNLPTDIPAESLGSGVQPKQIPDYIMIVSAPIRYQVFLPLRPCGKDWDLSIKELKYLYIRPDITSPFGGFENEPLDFRWIGMTRQTLADGTKISPAELAEDSVFKLWQVKLKGYNGATQVSVTNTQGITTNEWAIPVPGIPIPVTVRQMILTDTLVQTWTDYLNEQHQRPAFVAGQWYAPNLGGATPNTPAGTRIDVQFGNSHDKRDSDRKSFSLSLDPIDTERSVIATSDKCLYGVGFDPANFTNAIWRPATLQYCCAIMVRDPRTWQPVRNEYLYQVGSGTNLNFCKVVVKEDIQPWYIGNYTLGANTVTQPDGFQEQTFNSNGTNTNNYQEVLLQSQYYAQAMSYEFTLTTSQTASYPGLFSIDMDGAIQQVTYQIDANGGCTTTASQGTEHSWVTPSWDDRRQMSARQSQGDAINYVKYETQRRASLKGNFNT